MISIINQRLTSFWRITLGNPLAIHRLRRFSIYTWSNLAASIALLLIFYCTLARFSHYLEARRLAAIYPPDRLQAQLNMIAEASNIQRHLFTSFTTFSEPEYSLGQLAGIIILFVILVIGSIQSLYFRNRKRWDRVGSPHIRLLPLNLQQLQFALVDARFFTHSFFLLLGLLLLLAPSLEDKQWRTPSYMTAWYFAIFWVLLFAAYRAAQLQKPLKWRIMKNPMLYGCVVAIPVWLIVPFAILPLTRQWTFTAEGDSLGFNLFISTSLAAVVLLITCWLMKRRILKQLEEGLDGQ